MKHLLKTGAAMAIITVLTACGPSDEPAPRPQPPVGAVAGDLEIAPCVHVAREVEYAAECGTLIVPENRNDESSRLIALPVKRIRASGDTPAEPIFWLTGGPGTSNRTTARWSGFTKTTTSFWSVIAGWTEQSISAVRR